MRVVAWVVCILIFAYVLRRRARRGAATVVAPRVLLLDLSGGTDAALVQSDLALYVSVFGEGYVLGSENREILDRGHFDVVHVFAPVDKSDARIAAWPATNLFEALGRAGAKLVVLASEHTILPSTLCPPRVFNLVMTKARGDGFDAFLRVLYEKMFTGTGMVSAWLELAPQDERPNLPGAPILLFTPSRPWMRLAFQRAHERPE